jgi:succinate dehydrogenase/fumarate reductase flavoprotein subunit
MCIHRSKIGLGHGERSEQPTDGERSEQPTDGERSEQSMVGAQMPGTHIETDILVIGAGAGGLMAALAAKRAAPVGTKVCIVDSWKVGRSGHTAFSNAWTVVVSPDDDLDAITKEIIAGNDFIADQPLIHKVLETSWDRMKDLEGIGLEWPKNEDGSFYRRPTRGLKDTRVMYPKGGGMEFSWKLKEAIEEEGVDILDRFFVTGLMKGDTNRVTGAVGVHSRTGEFFTISAKATIIATNAITFRTGFVRDLTGTGTLLAYRAGAKLRNAEFSYLRPGTPKFYFEGIAFAIQDGASFVNEQGTQFMKDYEPEWGDRADVPRIARAMAMEKQKGNDPLYLDMSRIAPKKREFYFSSTVPWMQKFLEKLGSEARTDMFGKTPYYPQNQMTKMGIATDVDCRTDIVGLYAAGLAQAGCCNHFAGFHIGMCIGTGWASGEAAARDLETLPQPHLNGAETNALYKETMAPCDDTAQARSDAVLLDFQRFTGHYDIALWKHADRLDQALETLKTLQARFDELKAPDNHELVRIKETEAMMMAAEIIFRASKMREESRMSHFREDFDFRDDKNWLAWVDVQEQDGNPTLSKTPIPTPITAPDPAT